MRVPQLSLILTLTFFLTQGLVACFNGPATQESELSIFNGQRTDDYPAVVKVIRTEIKKICTGTFITDEHMVTAAHCIADTETGGLVIDGTGERSLKVVGYNLTEGPWPPSTSMTPKPSK